MKSLPETRILIQLKKLTLKFLRITEMMKMTDNKSNPLYDSDDIFDDIFNSAGKEDFTDQELDILDNIITLYDEKGNKVNFEFLDLIEYMGEEYVILLPADVSDSGEVVILRVEDTENPDEDCYASVEDEEILLTVFEKFKEKFKDEFNFTD